MWYVVAPACAGLVVFPPTPHSPIAAKHLSPGRESSLSSCVRRPQALLQVAVALRSQTDLTPGGGDPQLSGGGDRGTHADVPLPPDFLRLDAREAPQRITIREQPRYAGCLARYSGRRRRALAVP